MLGLAAGIEDETDEAVKAAEEAADEIAAVNFDALADMMQGTVAESRTGTSKAISSANATTGYGGSDDNDTPTDDSDSDQQMLEANFYFDKQKVGRIITPVVAKQLEWDGK